MCICWSWEEGAAPLVPECGWVWPEEVGQIKHHGRQVHMDAQIPWGCKSTANEIVNNDTQKLMSRSFYLDDDLSIPAPRIFHGLRCVSWKFRWHGSICITWKLKELNPWTWKLLIYTHIQLDCLFESQRGQISMKLYLSLCSAMRNGACVWHRWLNHRWCYLERQEVLALLAKMGWSRICPSAHHQGGVHGGPRQEAQDALASLLKWMLLLDWCTRTRMYLFACRI